MLPITKYDADRSRAIFIYIYIYIWVCDTIYEWGRRVNDSFLTDCSVANCRWKVLKIWQTNFNTWSERKDWHFVQCSDVYITLLNRALRMFLYYTSLSRFMLFRTQLSTSLSKSWASRYPTPIIISATFLLIFLCFLIRWKSVQVLNRLLNPFIHL